MTGVPLKYFYEQVKEPDLYLSKKKTTSEYMKDLCSHFCDNGSTPLNNTRKVIDIIRGA